MIEQIQTLHQHIFDPSRIPVAIIAILLVIIGGMVRGPLGGNAMPFYWHIVEIIFGKLGARMNKKNRPQGDLIFRGFILSTLVLIWSFIVGKGLDIAAQSYPQYSAVEIIGLALTLSAGAVWAAQGRLYRALNDKKVTPGAYFTVARSTRTDFSKSDDYTITRVGMGMGLRAFDKAIVAPVLWYLIFGLMGAYIYAGLAALQWIFGRDGHKAGLGKSINALEELLGFVPNILSGLFVALAGILTPTAGMTRAFLGLVRFKGRAKYMEGGLPVTAAAYALNVSLGGPTQNLDGEAIQRDWVGPQKATAQLVSKHLHRAVYISFMAHLLLMVALGGAIFLSKNIL